MLIEKPKAGTIRVALDRLSRCPKEISGTGRTQARKSLQKKTMKNLSLVYCKRNRVINWKALD